jgi:hypothetical protein
METSRSKNRTDGMLSTLVSDWQRTEVDGEASWKPFAPTQRTIGTGGDDSVQTGSGVHPTSYPMGTGGSFPGGKAAGE